MLLLYFLVFEIEILISTSQPISQLLKPSPQPQPSPQPLKPSPQPQPSQPSPDTVFLQSIMNVRMWFSQFYTTDSTSFTLTVEELEVPPFQEKRLRVTHSQQNGTALSLHLFAYPVTNLIREVSSVLSFNSSSTMNLAVGFLIQKNGCNYLSSKKNTPNFISTNTTLESYLFPFYVSYPNCPKNLSFDGNSTYYLGYWISSYCPSDLFPLCINQFTIRSFSANLTVLNNNDAMMVYAPTVLSHDFPFVISAILLALIFIYMLYFNTMFICHHCCYDEQKKKKILDCCPGKKYSVLHDTISSSIYHANKRTKRAFNVLLGFSSFLLINLHLEEFESRININVWYEYLFLALECFALGMVCLIGIFPGGFSFRKDKANYRENIDIIHTILAGLTLFILVVCNAFYTFVQFPRHFGIIGFVFTAISIIMLIVFIVLTATVKKNKIFRVYLLQQLFKNKDFAQRIDGEKVDAQQQILFEHYKLQYNFINDFFKELEKKTQLTDRKTLLKKLEEDKLREQFKKKLSHQLFALLHDQTKVIDQFIEDENGCHLCNLVQLFPCCKDRKMKVLLKSLKYQKKKLEKLLFTERDPNVRKDSDKGKSVEGRDLNDTELANVRKDSDKGKSVEGRGDRKQLSEIIEMWEKKSLNFRNTRASLLNPVTYGLEMFVFYCIVLTTAFSSTFRNRYLVEFNTVEPIGSNIPLIIYLIIVLITLILSIILMCADVRWDNTQYSCKSKESQQAVQQSVK